MTQDEWRTRMATESERELAEALVVSAARNEDLRKRLEEAETALRMYSGEKMRLGSTVTPKWADDYFAKKPATEGK